MPNDTIRAAATGLPKADRVPPPPAAPTAPRNCRAFALGADLGRLSASIARMRDPKIMQGAEIHVHDEVARMEKRTEALMQALTYAAAKSLSGALAQVIVSFEHVTGIIESPDLDPDEVVETLAGVQRCLFSIADVLVAQGAVPADQLGGHLIMPQTLNLLRIPDHDPLGLYSQDLPSSGRGEDA